jgi:hypothetical protein
MTLSRFATGLNRWARIARDVNAVRRGRIGQRLVNRAIGRTVGRLLRGVWR